MSRKYYSARKTTRPITLDRLKAIFGAFFKQFKQMQYFDEGLGFECADAGFCAGTAGRDPASYFLFKLRKEYLWPIPACLSSYLEDDLFDVIELLYDLVSEPKEGEYHSYNDCGMHYHTFNQPSGRAKFRSEINEFLSDYGDGFELAENGEIIEKADKGLDTLLSRRLPSSVGPELDRHMIEAIALFRRRHASLEDRRNAVRMLADLFESLRPKLESAITSKDESDLFNLANNFEIRHRNEKQKKQYDKALWLSWMFYFYLATLHFACRKLEGSSTTK
jgi:hypothetical protein